MAILKIEMTYNTDHYEEDDRITIPDKATHYTIENVIDYDEIKIRFRWFRKTKKGKWKEYNNFGQWVVCEFGVIGCLEGLKEIDDG